MNHDSVGVLGAGQWGTVLGVLAARAGRQVFVYDRDEARCREIQATRLNPNFTGELTMPSSMTFTPRIDEVFARAKLVLPIIPSKGMREFAKNVSSLVTPEHVIIHGSKGLEPGTHKRMSEVLLEETKTKLIGALSGPNIALELASGQPGATVVASPDDRVIQAATQALTSNQFRIYGNNDLVGVEWSGSFKNVLAVASGAINGLGYGQNVLAMMITRGMTEFSRLIHSMGGHAQTLLGLAGIGDTITTCTSPLSRNFRAGQMIAKGMSREEIESKLTVEGFGTIKTSAEIAKARGVDMPITDALKSSVFDGKPIQQALRDLMDRPSVYEFQLDQ